MKSIILTLIFLFPIVGYSGGSGGIGPAGSSLQDLLLNLQEARSEALQAQQGGLVGGGSSGIVWGVADSDGHIYEVIPKNWSLFDAGSISSDKVLLNGMNGVYTIDTKFTETLLDEKAVLFQELDLSQVPFDQNLQILILSSFYSLGGGAGSGPPGIFSSNGGTVGGGGTDFTLPGALETSAGSSANSAP